MAVSAAISRRIHRQVTRRCGRHAPVFFLLVLLAFIAVKFYVEFSNVAVEREAELVIALTRLPVSNTAPKTTARPTRVRLVVKNST